MSGDIVERLRSHFDSMCMNDIVCGDAADEIERLRAEVADLTASGLALCDESDAFRANLAAERALADQLAEALRDACDIRPFISVWQEAQKALTAYEEARCGW